MPRGEVLIHPSFDPNWASYALAGLAAIWSEDALRPTTEGFPEIRDYTERSEGGLFWAIAGGTRLVVQTDDDLAANAEALDWADVYAKVNLDEGAIPEPSRRKVVPFLPMFAIDPFGPATTLRLMLATLRPGMRSRTDHVKRYLYRSRRYFPRLDDFRVHRPPTEPQVLYISSLWRSAPQATLERRWFMEACRDQPGLRFVGGFRRRIDAHWDDELEGLRMDRMEGLPARHSELERRSLFSFANPSVEGNPGWRLGINLALGRAVISIRNHRRLVEPLTHGENVHYVDADREQIRDAVTRLTVDHAYRRRLERGAFEYFWTHASPELLVRRALGLLPARRKTPGS